jgi:AcrR family transcriptional regulator
VSDRRATTTPLPAEAKQPAEGPTGAESGTRAAIVEAAKQCFAEYGYRGTTNKRIADRANVTTALIYYYFTSKAELFSAVFASITAERHRLVRRAVTEQSTFAGKLRALIDDLINLWREDPSFVQVFAMASLEIQRNPELAEALKSPRRNISDTWAEFLDEATRWGQLPPGANSPAMSEMFVIWFTGLMTFLVTRGTDDVKQASQQARQASEAFISVVEQALISRPAASDANDLQ